MCGICGLFDLTGQQRADPALVGRMLSLMVHRGPDDGGQYARDDLAFGMRRLSIIDVAGGQQPIANEDGTIHVVLNGEIYNYVELREDLQARGHVLRTRSDTEALVHLYEDHGAGFVEALNGMFALALYDAPRRRLVLARDRLGKKPLYHTTRDGLFAFSSEIKPLLSLPGAGVRVDLDALNLLLRDNYVPGPRTLFEGIGEIEPGGLAIVEDGAVRRRRYWDLLDRLDPDPPPVDPGAATGQVEALLRDAVAIRMRSDVPVGAFLSGGIDSSLIVGHMTDWLGSGGTLQTFSIGFHEEAYDETPYAAYVAERFGTRHTHAVMAFDASLDVHRDVLWHLEEPHGDASFVPVYQLSELASRSVKVVLTGDGGDEVFGGYERHGAVAAAAGVLGAGPAVERSLQDGFVFDDGLRLSVLREPARRELPLRTSGLPRWVAAPAHDAVRALMIVDTLQLLADNNVVKPDRMGMAWGLEARCPLLDYRLVEYALNLRGEVHVAGGATKHVLKTLAGRFLPPDMVTRRKQQFTVPIGEWIRNDVGGVFTALLRRLGAREWFDGAAVARLLTAHRAGTANLTRPLRLLVAIELWAELFVDRHPLEGPVAERRLAQAGERRGPLPHAG